jgi:hypothetical protein
MASVRVTASPVPPKMALFVWVHAEPTSQLSAVVVFQLLSALLSIQVWSAAWAKVRDRGEARGNDSGGTEAVEQTRFHDGFGV